MGYIMHAFYPYLNFPFAVYVVYMYDVALYAVRGALSVVFCLLSV